MTKSLDRDRAERLERACYVEAEQAAKGLARAAALSEESRKYTDAPLGSEHNLWFLVRTLAREYGFGYESMVEDARFMVGQ